MCTAMSNGGVNMEVRGWFICNGVQYAFVSLKGDVKWVYRELLKYMKKWSIRRAQIDVNDECRYYVFVRDKRIRIYRCIDGHRCSYRREG